MDTTLIVDGYNVINAWSVLIKLKEESLDHARDRLNDLMAGHGAFKGYDIVVVYDAHLSSATEAVEEERGGVTVVYTGQGQTADSYIERLAYKLVRQRRTVYVVTSDWAEQMTVLGAGAYRISASELYRELQANAKQQQRYTDHPLTYKRNEVGSRVNSTVAKKLDELRRSR